MKQTRTLWKRMAGLFLSILLLLSLAGCSDIEFILLEETKEDSGDFASFEKDSTLELHFLDIGQGDSTLIVCDGEAMLIDAGKNDQGTEIQSYLESKGITKLKYAIGTHPDSDHIGGLDVILYKFGAEKVLMPNYSKNTKTYDDVVQIIENQHLKRLQPDVGEVYQLGSAEFTVVGPAKDGDYGSNANDYSIAILLTHGENRFLLTGDAEEDAEADMLESGINLKADVYKAAHHGSKTANTEEFLEEVDPAYAVISCGEGNSYGHPHAEVLNRFRSMGIQVFRTDEQGTVVLKSDGKQIVFNMSPSDSWKAGEPGSASQATEETERKASVSGQKTNQKTTTNSQKTNRKTTYYINTNTGKFHKPDCRYAPDKQSAHCEISTQTKSALKKKGYEPCGHCLAD